MQCYVRIDFSPCIYVSVCTCVVRKWYQQLTVDALYSGTNVPKGGEAEKAGYQRSSAESLFTDIISRCASHYL